MSRWRLGAPGWWRRRVSRSMSPRGRLHRPQTQAPPCVCEAHTDGLRASGFDINEGRVGAPVLAAQAAQRVLPR